MRSSSGNSGENKCEDYPEKYVMQNIPRISFKGEELLTAQSRQPTSKETIMETYSGGDCDKHNLVSSDSEHNVNPNFGLSNSQFEEYTSTDPEYKLDINHNSEQLSLLDTNLKIVLDKSPDIHSKNSRDFTSVGCGNDGHHQNEAGLNSSSSTYEEQDASSNAPACVINNAVRLQVSDMDQPISSRPEDKLQIQEPPIKRAEDTCDEGEPVSNKQEFIMLNCRNIRVTNFQPECTEYEAVSSVSENSGQARNTETTKNMWSSSKEQEPVGSGLEGTVCRKSGIKFRLQNQGGSGTETTIIENNCKVQKMSESSDAQHSVNGGPFQKKKSIKMENSSDISEEQNSRGDYNMDRTKIPTIKLINQRSEGQQLYDSDTDNVKQMKTSSEVKYTCDISEEQEQISSGYGNKAQINCSKIKYLKESSKYQEFGTETGSPSQKKRKNLGENNSRDRSETQEECKRTKKSLNKSTEENEVSNSSGMHRKIRETVKYTALISADLTEDLTNQVKKTQHSDQKNEKAAAHATPEHKQSTPTTMTLYESRIVGHGKGSQTLKDTHTLRVQEGTLAQMHGEDVMDAQESEEISKNATAVIQGEAEHKVANTADSSWSYTRENFGISHFTQTSNVNTEIILKAKKCYPSGWRNSGDAEKSMECFNEWRQKLDHTKASCEDMLAKLKRVRDNGNIIHTPKYYCTDKGINWEGESANKPTISDIIKKLSQTQPKREFFRFNPGRKFTDIIPEHALSNRREKLKKNQYDFNMVNGVNINSAAKNTQRLCSGSCDQGQPVTTNVYNSSINRNPIPVAVLPHIRQRIKQPPASSLFCSGQKVDSFCAVSINLKTLQASQNLRQHLLLPLGSDQCLGVNSTIPAPIEGSLL
jgi:hypothetical protein